MNNANPKRKNATGWTVAVCLVIAAVIGGWLLFGGGADQRKAAEGSEPAADQTGPLVTLATVNCRNGSTLLESLERAGYKEPLSRENGNVSFRKSLGDQITVDKNGKGTDERSRGVLEAIGCTEAGG